MSRVVFLEDRCKGCLLCVSVCPLNLLVPSGRFNRRGYQTVEPGKEKEKCTACSSCALICPDLAIRVFKTRKSEEGEGE